MKTILCPQARYTDLVFVNVMSLAKPLAMHMVKNEFNIMELPKVKKIIQDVVQKLVDKNYKSIYEDDYWKRLNVEEMRHELDDYGGTFTMPPDTAFDEMEIYIISEEEITLDCPLWNDGKRSDLTLIGRLRIIDGRIRYAVEAIHIL